MKSVQGVVLMVFSLAMLSQILGIGLSFVLSVSPSAVAGLIAAFSYVIAIQIKKLRERREVRMSSVPTDRVTGEVLMQELDTQGKQHHH
jgi:uncharacterized membrane protein YoaK (UPF0700 family)